MKIKINARFTAYWGPLTPKVDDVLNVEYEDRGGYWVKLDKGDKKYFVYYHEADLVPE